MPNYLRLKTCTTPKETTPMRQETLVIVLSMLAIFVGTAIPVGAVRDGAVDGNSHPYVGLMVAQDASRNPLWRCSGTLMSPTIFLTAGHCTETPAAHIEIWFDSGDPDPIPLASGYPAAGPNPCARITGGYPCTGEVGGTPFTHPLYNP